MYDDNSHTIGTNWATTTVTHICPRQLLKTFDLQYVIYTIGSNQ